MTISCDGIFAHTCRIAGYGWCFATLVLLAEGAIAGPGKVESEQRISEVLRTFEGTLPDFAFFGSALGDLPDLDGDSIADLAVGSEGDNDGGLQRGAVWILFLKADGSVKGEQKISDTEGTFIGALDDGDSFGSAVAFRSALLSLAVGAPYDDDGGTNRGAVWLLQLTANGKVGLFTKISDTGGEFKGTLRDQDEFGYSLANLGDLNGDAVPDLVVGAPGDDGAGNRRGAVWIIFMKADNTVLSHLKITPTAFGGLSNSDGFGTSVARLGDLDGDGVADIAVGAPGDDDGGPEGGAVWILHLNSDGSIKKSLKILHPFRELPQGGLSFGFSVAAMDDLDEDGTVDLAVGALPEGPGLIWIHFLNPDGTVKDRHLIGRDTGGFGGTIGNGDSFGSSIVRVRTALGTRIAVGADQADDAGEFNGTVWMLSLQGGPLQPDLRIGPRRSPASHRGNDIRNTSGDGQNITVRFRDRRRVRFYFSVENDNDGTNDFLVRAPRGPRGTTARYFRVTGGRINVTGAITRAGRNLPEVGAGRAILLCADLRIRRSGRTPRARLRFTAHALPKVNRLDRAKVKLR